MSIQGNKLKDIADAIREKDGTALPIVANDFPERIRAIKTGWESITDNVRHISLSANPEDGGTVSGGGVASDGMTITINAEKNSDFKFNGWKEGDTIVNTEPLYTFLVSSDHNLTADFRELERIMEVYEVNIPSYCNSITYINGKFIAVIDNIKKIIYSEDGVTWIAQDLPENEHGTKSRIIYGAGKYVLELDENALFYSEDLITWKKKDILVSSTIGLSYITFGNGKFIAYSPNNMHVYYSEDIITWNDSGFVIEYGANLRNIVYYNGKFIIFCFNKIKYSEDGITWSESIIPVTGKWDICAYSNEKIITLDCDNGVNIIYSNDGVTWNTSTIPNAFKYCRGIAYGNEKFIIINNNNVVYSKDGITWKTVTTNFSKKYFRLVAYGNNKFVFANTSYEKLAYSNGEISTV